LKVETVELEFIITLTRKRVEGGKRM